jgi:leucyl/phenylalanyl-tRNA--protein transferase
VGAQPALRPSYRLVVPSVLDPAAFFAGADVARAPRDLVALGGTLDAPTLAAAYRAGCFPWPSSEDDAAAESAADRQTRRLAARGRVPVLAGNDGLVPWCSPDPRAVLLADALVVRRSLRQRLRRSGWTATLDAAFDDVVAGCADRDSTWITSRMRGAYGALHRSEGAHGASAHSVEVWDGDRLVGGVYGVLVGSVFCGESMLHRSTDASKVALVVLCDRLLEAGVRLLDTQQATEHMASLGQVVVRRGDYLQVLAALRDRPTRLATDRRPVAALVR